MARRVSASMEKPRRAAKTHCPQHAQLVLGEALLGMSDSPDELGREVFATAHVVKATLLDRIEEESVDGEVPAPGVLLGVVSEADVTRPASIVIFSLASEGGHLDPSLAFANQNDTELCADCQRTGKVTLDLFGARVGRNVVVSGIAAQQTVAHAAARPVGGMPPPAEVAD